MAKRIGGIATVTVSGRVFPLRGSFTVSPSAVERQGIPVQDGVHGYTENPRVPYIEGNISLPPEVSIEDLDGMTNETVQADLANGRSYVLREAWTRSAHEIDTKEGQAKVRWEGISCREI